MPDKIKLSDTQAIRNKINTIINATAEKYQELKQRSEKDGTWLPLIKLSVELYSTSEYENFINFLQKQKDTLDVDSLESILDTACEHENIEIIKNFIENNSAIKANKIRVKAILTTLIEKYAKLTTTDEGCLLLSFLDETNNTLEEPITDAKAEQKAHSQPVSATAVVTGPNKRKAETELVRTIESSSASASGSTSNSTATAAPAAATSNSKPRPTLPDDKKDYKAPITTVGTTASASGSSHAMKGLLNSTERESYAMMIPALDDTDVLLDLAYSFAARKEVGLEFQALSRIFALKPHHSLAHLAFEPHCLRAKNYYSTTTDSTELETNLQLYLKQANKYLRNFEVYLKGMGNNLKPDHKLAFQCLQQAKNYAIVVNAIDKKNHIDIYTPVSSLYFALLESSNNAETLKIEVTDWMKTHLSPEQQCKLGLDLAHKNDVPNRTLAENWLNEAAKQYNNIPAICFHTYHFLFPAELQSHFLIDLKNPHSQNTTNFISEFLYILFNEWGFYIPSFSQTEIENLKSSARAKNNFFMLYYFSDEQIKNLNASQEAEYKTIMSSIPLVLTHYYKGLVLQNRTEVSEKVQGKVSVDKAIALCQTLQNQALNLFPPIQTTTNKTATGGSGGAPASENTSASTSDRAKGVYQSDLNHHTGIYGDYKSFGGFVSSNFTADTTPDVKREGAVVSASSSSAFVTSNANGNPLFSSLSFPSISIPSEEEQLRDALAASMLDVKATVSTNTASASAAAATATASGSTDTKTTQLNTLTYDEKVKAIIAAAETQKFKTAMTTSVNALANGASGSPAFTAAAPFQPYQLSDEDEQLRVVLAASREDAGAMAAIAVPAENDIDLARALENSLKSENSNAGAMSPVKQPPPKPR